MSTAIMRAVDVHRRTLLLTLPFAAVLTWLGWSGGAYGFTLRTEVAVVLWVAIGAAFSLRILGRRPSGGANVVGGLLAGFAVWTGISAAWAPSAENAILSFDRVTLYLGVFLLVVLVAGRGDARAVLDGVTAALVVITGVALTSRLFPGVFPPQQMLQFLPGSQARLSYPVNYWNGLGILLGLAFPLLLRIATPERSTLVRAAALVPLPAVGAAVYLTGSRGGIAVVGLGVIAFVVLTSERWSAVAAVAIGGVGCCCAMLVLIPRKELLDRGFSTPQSTAQGHEAAVLLTIICVATGAVFALVARYVPSQFRRSRPIGIGLSAVAAAGAIALVVAAHPVRLFDEFKQPRLALATSGQIEQHVLSGGGTGRWQLWSAAVDEFRTQPTVGRGAGTFPAWWLAHGSLPVFSLTAHSLYLQTLGELGIIGLALLAAGLVTGLVMGLRAVRHVADIVRVELAAALAAFAAWLFACAVDWVWELTIDAIVGIVLLGVVVVAAHPPAVARRTLSRSWRVGLAVAGVVAAAVNLVPLLAQLRINASQAAVRAGRASAARPLASQARSLEPWASSPYLQLALVDELQNSLPRARTEIAGAIRRDPDNWQLWLVRARIATKAGAIADAERSLAAARRLNPHSSLFVAPR